MTFYEKFAAPRLTGTQQSSLSHRILARQEPGADRPLTNPHFHVAAAPPGARLLPFAALGKGECRWGFESEGADRFCGLPVDPAEAGNILRRNYCRHHAALVCAGGQS